MADGVDVPARGSPGWWDHRYAEATMLWSVEPNRFVVEEAGGLVPGRALDLACGEGRNAIWLARSGWQVMAVDFSAVAVDRARDLAEDAGAHVQWVQADALTWPGADRTPPPAYDLVLLAYLQVSPEQRRAALDRAAAATVPTGSLLVVAHDLRNLTDGTGGPQDPTLLWTPGEVARPGFTAVRAETSARPVESATAWDTVVRLVRDR